MEKKLSPEVKGVFEKEVSDEAKRKEIYRLLDIYQYIPQTSEEVSYFVQHSEVLTFTSVMVFFDTLHKELGYNFDSSFVQMIYNSTDYLSSLYRRGGQMIGVERGSGREAEILGQWKHDTEQEMSKVLAELERTVESGLFKEAFDRFQNKFNFPISAAGLSVFMKCFNDKNVEKIMDSTIDVNRIKEQVGNVFDKNEIVCIIYAITEPDIFGKFTKIINGLKRPWLFVQLGPETMEVFREIDDPDGLIGFWNWFEHEFCSSPLLLNNVAELYAQFAVLKNVDLGHELFSTETANGVREVASKFGKKLETVDLVENLESYIWTQEELDAFDRIKDLYSFQIDEEIDVWRIHKGVQEILSKKMLTEITDKTNVPLYSKFDKSWPVEFCLESIVLAEEYIGQLTKTIPNARDILKVIVNAGFELPGLRGVVPPMILSIMRRFGEDNELLVNWEKVSTAYKFSEFDFAYLNFFVYLSSEQQNLLTASDTILKIGKLHDVYDFKFTVESLVAFVMDLSQDSELQNAVDVLLTQECQDFYQKHSKVLSDKGQNLTRDWQKLRLVGVVSFYKKAKEDPRLIRWAQRWSELGKDIDPFFTSDEIVKELPVLDDPRFERLCAAVKKMGIQIGFSSHVAAIIDNTDILEEEEFQNFMKLLVDTFGVWKGFSMLDKVISVYRNPETKKFLSNVDVQNFYKELHEYGFVFYSPGASGVSLEWNCERLLVFYKTKGLLKSVDKLNKTFGINVKEMVRVIEEVEVVADISNNIVDTRGFDFFGELKTLTDSKDFELLVSKKTVELVKFCENTYGYKFSLLDINSIMAVMKNKRLQSAIRDSRMKDTLSMLDKLGLKIQFSFGIVDVLVDVVENKIPFEHILELLKTNYKYKPSNLGDLLCITDLIGRENVLAKLESKDFVETVEELKKERKYKFQIKDVYSLIYLSENRSLIDKIYDPAMDDIAEKVFGVKLKNDYPVRLRFYETFEDKEKRAKLVSPEFTAVRERFLRQFGVSGGIDNAEGYLKLIECPEVFDFLKAINFKAEIRSLVCFFDAVPSLVQMSRIGAEKYIVTLREASKRDFANTGDYLFNPTDGAAWDILIKQNPDVSLFVEKVKKFRKETGKWLFSANDLYVWFTLGEKFSTDRKMLESNIAKCLVDDVHRVDASFDSYSSYNDLSKYDIIQLNKIHLIQKWLKSNGVCKSILEFIRKDVNEYPYSEIGSVITLNADGIVRNNEHLPRHNFNNGSYMPPTEAALDHSVSLATTHLHALKYNESFYAGPSGGRFSMGGDISVAQILGREAVVITSLSENEFCVHFYTSSGDVIFIGKIKG